MSGKKLSPEDELEKQYSDYKAQFEEWKERNSESVGSDAYVRYVKQFEDWERDVEKRRAIVRQKAEQERLAAEQDARRKNDTTGRRRNEEAEAAAQRAAEQNRIANRQRRLVAQAAASTGANAASKAAEAAAVAASAATGLSERQPREIQHQQSSLHHAQQQPHATQIRHTSQQQQQPHAQQQQRPAANTSQQQNAEDSPMEISSMANVMQQMLNFVMVSEKQQNGSDVNKENPVMDSERISTHHQPSHHQQHMSTASISHQPQQQLDGDQAAATAGATATTVVQPSEPQTPPQLWGNDGANYSITDPMFRRWNVRAAPPNFRIPYEPPPPTVLTNPYWLLVEKMREKKLILAPNFRQPLPPAAAPSAAFTPQHPPLNLSQQSPQGKPPSLLAGTMAPPPQLAGGGMPFRPHPHHAPPPFHPHHHRPMMGGGPPMYALPPPNFHMPPPPAAAAAGGPQQSYYKMK